MKTKPSLLVVCFAVMLLLWQSAAAQGLGQLPLDKRMSILEDKVFLTFPGLAVDRHRTAGRMADAPDPHLRTEIQLDFGDMHMEFRALNWFCLPGEDFQARELKKGEAGYETKKVLLDQDGLLAILSTPVRFDSTRKSIWIQELVVRTQENMLLKINVHINQAAFAHKDELLQLSERVFRTLQMGAADKVLTARQEKHALPGSGKALVFDLPAKCYLLEQGWQGNPTFQIHSLPECMDTLWQQIDVYVGPHPDMAWKDFDLTTNNYQETQGSLLGNKITWRTFHPKDDYDIREQAIPLDQVGAGLQLYVTMSSNNKALIDELTKIAERIQLVDQ